MMVSIVFSSHLNLFLSLIELVRVMAPEDVEFLGFDYSWLMAYYDL